MLAVSCKQSVTWSQYIGVPDQVSLRPKWLDIGQVPDRVIVGQDGVEVNKHAKKEEDNMQPSWTIIDLPVI